VWSAYSLRTQGREDYKCDTRKAYKMPSSQSNKVVQAAKRSEAPGS